MKKQICKCECGRKLDYITSPFMQPEKRVCACGRLHYVDGAVVDWERVNGTDKRYDNPELIK